MSRVSHAAFGLLLVLAAAAPARGQDRSAPKSFFTTRVAMVSNATVCHCDEAFMPTPRMRDLVIVAVGRRFPLAASESGRWDVTWVPELIPVLYSNRTADSQLEVWVCGPRRYCGRSTSDDVFNVRAFGAGIMPLAFQGGLRVADRLHVRTRISAGAIQLSEPVPLAQGTKFNFIADGATTLEFRTSERVSVSAGVALNHISNGGLGRVNLGMDSRLFELGVVIGR